MDPDGRYYYIEIEVEHYQTLVTYDGVVYSRSGSTLQILDGQELERAVLKSTGLSWDAFESAEKLYMIWIILRLICFVKKQ